MQTSGQSTSPAGAAVQMLPVTTGTLILIVLLAIATVAMIWWGARLLRARRSAIDTLEDAGRIERPDTGEVRPADGPAAAPADTPATIDGDSGMMVTAAAPGLEPVPVTPPTAPPPPPIAEGPGLAAPVPPVTPPPPEASAPPEAAVPPLTPEPVSGGNADDLTLMKGVGPRVAAQLAERGITRFADLAALSPTDAEALDAQLGNFRGRMFRDRWIEQARYLADGDRTGFEAEFGKL